MLPYGEEYNPQITTNHYKFTGKERDSETGFDYFGARYYSKGLGRFITPDWNTTPVAVPHAILSNPQTLNVFADVENNPTTHIDLDGHEQRNYHGWRELKEIASNVGHAIAKDVQIIGNSYTTIGQILSENQRFSFKNFSYKDANNIGKNVTLLISGESALAEVGELGNLSSTKGLTVSRTLSTIYRISRVYGRKVF